MSGIVNGIVRAGASLAATIQRSSVVSSVASSHGQAAPTSSPTPQSKSDLCQALYDKRQLTTARETHALVAEEARLGILPDLSDNDREETLYAKVKKRSLEAKEVAAAAVDGGRWTVAAMVGAMYCLARSLGVGGNSSLLVLLVR